jgi:hypothetical protein
MNSFFNLFVFPVLDISIWSIYYLKYNRVFRVRKAISAIVLEITSDDSLITIFPSIISTRGPFSLRNKKEITNKQQSDKIKSPTVVAQLGSL